MQRKQEPTANNHHTNKHKERDNAKHEDKAAVKGQGGGDKDRLKLGLAIGKIMTSQPVITAEEQRIHELDQDVERVFDVRKRLGKGAYGIVWKAVERQKKTTVALKKIFDAFRDETDAQRTYREVIFLRAFRHHPNIIRLIDVYKASNNLDFYLVFEFMESDLHNVIKRGDILKDIHKRFIMYQLVNAIKYMHSGNVVHRDLKPSNILIDSKCRLKVADFGLARTLYKKRNTDFDDLEHGPMLTDYVATRWYRAPEILVASRTYTKAIDMWSLGCILGELIRQKPLFQGTSTINQIEKIVSALPDVTQQDIDSIGASFGTVLLSKKINRDRRHSLEEMLRHCSDDAMSLLKSLLVLDPHRRLTAKAAILHPYVTRFRTASADMELRSDVHPPLRDDVRYNIDEYRSNLYEAMVQESWSSGRTDRTTSPTSNRDSRLTTTSTTSTTTTTTTTTTTSTTTKKPSRSVSRTRTLSASQTTNKVAPVAARRAEPNHLGVSTLQRNITQSWAESEQKRTSSAVPPKQSVSLPTHVKDVPQNGRSHQPSSTSMHPKQPAAAAAAAATEAKMKITAEAANAMRRELDGLAATAPRSKIPTWHSQKQAHVQFQSKAEAQVKALLNTNMPAYTTQLEKVKWGDKMAGGGDLASPKDLETMMARSRMLRKIKEKKTEEESEQKREREKEKEKEKEKDKKDRDRYRDRGRDREKYNQEALQEKSQPHHNTKPVAVLHDHKIVDVQANRRQDLTAEEMKRRRQERRHREEKQQQQQQQPPPPPPPRVKTEGPEDRQEKKDNKERTRTNGMQIGARGQRLGSKGTTDMVLQLMTRKLQRLSEQKELVQAEKKQNSDAPQQLENGTVWCYRARINNLEAEMAKCKEQLLKFLVENQEMLTHRRLRHHFNLLLPKKEEQQQEELPIKGDAAGGDAGTSLPPDPGQSYENFRLEQDKLRHLQLQEFLARDESNDYELPDLGNVYKAKSYHSFTQPLYTASTASSSDSCPSPCPEGEFAEHFHSCGKLYPSHSMAKLLVMNNAHHFFNNEKRQQQQQQQQQQQPSGTGPSYDHIRMRPQDIQEAQFPPRRNH